MSPKFRKEDGFVFKIYSNEEERMHIHVVKAENEAKFWLEPSIELAENYGFGNNKEYNWSQHQVDLIYSTIDFLETYADYNEIIKIFLPLLSM